MHPGATRPTSAGVFVVLHRTMQSLLFKLAGVLIWNCSIEHLPRVSRVNKDMDQVSPFRPRRVRTGSAGRMPCIRKHCFLLTLDRDCL